MTDASSVEKSAQLQATVVDGYDDGDERELARMGYKQELK